MILQLLYKSAFVHSRRLLVVLVALAFFKSIAPVDDEGRLLPRKRAAAMTLPPTLIQLAVDQGRARTIPITPVGLMLCRLMRTAIMVKLNHCCSARVSNLTLFRCQKLSRVCAAL